MKHKEKYSKKDVAFVLCCAVFLLMNICAIGSSGLRRAKEMVCLSNLREWGVIYQMFTNDHNGSFTIDMSVSWIRGAWLIGLRPYIQPGTNLLRCPEATKRNPKGYFWGGTYNTYDIPINVDPEESSYGTNCWNYDPPPKVGTLQGRPTEWNWRTVNVEGVDNIPVFADTMFRGGGPYEFGICGDPPEYDGQWISYNREMMHFCINRHNGAVNHLFMDWSARKIGLKQLWKLKWHRQFNTNGPWTKAGDVRPEDWPEWMRNFKDY